MQKLKNVIKNKNLIFPALVIILSLVVCWSLFRPGYFSMHDDIQVMRLYQMEKCFLDGQIPCRWVPDMGAGFGYPLFNFYSVFPYYLGVFFRLFGISFVSVVKILFGLSLVLSGVFMYFLAKEFFGKLGGLAGAVFYVYAPYRAVDIYVRGALAESWGIVFFPLIFLSVYKYIKEKSLDWYLLSVVSLTFLFLSHNIMSLIFVPAVLVWVTYWLIAKKRRLKEIFLIFILAVGLSAFYLLPAFFEKSLVNISWLISDYFDFRNHFVSLKQLFVFRSFGYGPSILGPDDTISFQLGWIHWLLVVVAGFLLVWSVLRNKKKQTVFLLIIFGIWVVSLYMIHAKSVLIWEAIPLLSFVQFPWRFLALAIFAGSFIVASVILFVPKKMKSGISFLLIILVVILNFGYFRPECFYPKKTDKEILSQESWEEQSKGALLDYLPKGVKRIPEKLAPSSPWVVDGSASVTEFSKRSNFWRFTIDVLGSRQAKIAVPVFDFPQWKILIDQKSTPFTVGDGGEIQVMVSSGKHTVVGWFENTPLRSLANFITTVSFFGLIVLVIKKNEKFA